ncbi:MAG: hypothetical protein GEU91_03485 [Rhizobiales bacterium]|nr:hypothetical protein [Hyphomicrobiales bacterium]
MQSILLRYWLSGSKAMTSPTTCGPALVQGRRLAPDTDTLTVAILGVPRGGTTMVAGAAIRCGLPIGTSLPGNLEDPDFVGGDLARLEAAVVKRNASLKVWGWKYPRAAGYLPHLLPKLRNPRIVMVWRDLMATAARRIARGDPIYDVFLTASRIQKRNLALMAAAPCPILHVSYEKAILDPEPFVEMLAAFVGGKLPADMNELRAFMQPGSYKPVESSELILAGASAPDQQATAGSRENEPA